MSGSIEEFDDDTDFALPVPPTAAGSAVNDSQMAQMQEMMARMQAGQGSGVMDATHSNPVDDELSAQAKKWVTVYPIYFDAKRKYMKGCRRVAYENACMWPKSDMIRSAVSRLTFMHAHEPLKRHPQDWENPGRVKVQLFDESGKAKNKSIGSKKELLNAIAKQIQSQCGGKPPPLTKSMQAVSKKEGTKEMSKIAQTGVHNKNAANKSQHKRQRVSTKVRVEDRIKGSQPPPLSGRYPVNSPAREAGLLNADLGGMMGGLQGMGPLGAMMGQMGLGDDDDDDEEEKKKAEEEEKNKKKDPMQQLGRRQRKRVVRIAR